MDFANFHGNEKLKEQLACLSKQNRIPHAIIIEGGDGENRKALADLISATALCISENDKPCGECKHCVKAAAYCHSSVYRAKDKDSKSENVTVEEIRNIIRLANIIPNEAQFNIFHIYEADKRLSSICQNALLKIIEEPPKSAIFILTCTNAQSLLETIRSRSTVFTLQNEQIVSDNTKELAEKIALDMINLNEMHLLISTSKLTDKKTATEVLNYLVALLRDGLAVSVGANAVTNDEIAQKLRKKLTKQKLIELIEITNDCIYKFSQNANTALLTTWLCSNYRRISWQK